jgi:hypothetical protein
LLLLCAGLGAFLYFYEIKGGERREKAKQEETRIWKLDRDNIQRIDLASPGQSLTAVRVGDREWKLTAPRSLAADSEELNRMANAAAELSREGIVESQAADLGRFGLDPPQTAVELKLKDGKQYKILFGSNNPTGSSTYAALPGKSEVFLVSTSVSGAFQKKFEDLRNRAVLSFDQAEVQSLQLVTAKGTVRLTRENDRWWLEGEERLPADASAVSEISSTLSTAKVKEFADVDSGKPADFGFDTPLVDVRLTYGKDKGIKHLIIGKGKADSGAAESYAARDDSRDEIFYVDRELVEKLQKTSADLRDKALASFERWDIDSISLTNERGTLAFTKSGGDWLLGNAKKKTKWDAVNGILDALEKPVKEIIDHPASAASYGLDKPRGRVVLKQGADVKLDCNFGKAAADGVYARVQGEKAVKLIDTESWDKLNRSEADFIDTLSQAAPAGADHKH